MQLINTIGTSWKMSIKEEKKLIMLRIYDHHLIKNNQFFFFQRVAESYMQIIKAMKNLLSALLWLFFLDDKLRLEKVYLLPCKKTTINMKLCVFQYKILNNVLYLNKMLFRFGKDKETPI